jgi:hypothetical protein
MLKVLRCSPFIVCDVCSVSVLLCLYRHILLTGQKQQKQTTLDTAHGTPFNHRLEQQHGTLETAQGTLEIAQGTLETVQGIPIP